MPKNIVVGRGKTPFFTQKEEAITYKGLENSLDCEVLIVGGGITGLLVAYHFLKAGKEVCIVDKNVIGSGQTRFLPPILQYDADANLSFLKKKYGQEDALYFYRQFRQSLTDIENIISEIASPCGFSKRDCFYFTDEENHVEDIQDEYRFRKYGGFDVECIDKSSTINLFSFPVQFGIYSKNLAAEINPVKFARDLASYLSVNGVQIFEDTEVEIITEKYEGGYFADTSQGFRINAKAICDCRGYEILKRYKSLGKIYTCFTSFTNPVSAFPGWPNHCVIKNDRKIPLFLYNTADNRIMASGFDSKFIYPDGLKSGLDFSFFLNFKYDCLHRAVEDMFFGIDNLFPQFDYCGVYAKTRDGLPFIGEESERKKFYYACCCNKNNIIYANIAGKILSAEYDGKQYEGAKLFSLI